MEEICLNYQVVEAHQPGGFIGLLLSASLKKPSFDQRVHCSLNGGV